MRFKRDALGFPTFWTFQIAGWVCFSLSVVINVLPGVTRSRSIVALEGSGIFVATLFAASCALRPVCRALAKRGFPWITLEVRGFLWSLLAGAIASSVIQLVGIRNGAFSWISWIGSFMQAVFILFFWCSLYFSIKQWQQSLRERERLLRAEAEARDARLSALRYQLNPHFLFNSLNAVSTFVLEGNAPAATRMLAQIGEFLRIILDREAVPEIPLSEEIEFTRQYLAIEQTRLGDRLKANVDVSPETLDALVPGMLLQPLVENAVRHGVAPLIAGGTVQIESRLQGGRLQLSVRNSGSPRAQVARPPLPANGIGISNTAERLETLYAADHRFTMEWPETGGCEVTVELPFRKSVHPQEAESCAP